MEIGNGTGSLLDFSTGQSVRGDILDLTSATLSVVFSSSVVSTDGSFDISTLSFLRNDTLNDTSTYQPLNDSSTQDTPTTKSLVEIVIISILVGILSFLTVLGNLLVIIAFKIEKQLQTISNYFLLSLAVADMTIGFVSMPLYTVYLLMGYWPLGPVLCDLWLSLDYLMSNASAANLMLISFDRYFSVTRPLTYRAKRTSRKVGLMIGMAWLISLVLWPPWIFAWPYLEGKRTVPEKECYIQFLYTNSWVTIGTHLLAFWIPVVIMTVLYFKIYRETEKRQKRMPMLQATKDIKGFKKRVNGKTEEECNRRVSTQDIDDVYDMIDDIVPEERSVFSRCACCKIDRDDENEDSSTSDPASPMGANSFEDQHSHSRNISLRSRSSISAKGFSFRGSNGTRHNRRTSFTNFVIPLMAMESRAQASSFVASPSTLTGTSSRVTDLSLDSSSPLLDENEELCTIVIKIPRQDSTDSFNGPTIKMISPSTEELSNSSKLGPSRELDYESDIMSLEDTNSSSNYSLSKQASKRRNDIPLPKGTPALGRRTRYADHTRNAQQARIAAQAAYNVKQQRARKKRTERKQDKKAAKTLSAILLAFVVTWLPYNIIAITESFRPGSVPLILYNFGKYML
ncbi:hypothetical protein FSP39_023497 [Pinctada imbricata]|uniref:G-protein coupled receptors family 1 profile domain-containing protein n=1 Tax=Pinctada imbricata TaxID=66713 RepID=A0AA88Y868_PINIB|nr:hypothetical protein FSP39_023497 [Pinctada imbricata]